MLRFSPLIGIFCFFSKNQLELIKVRDATISKTTTSVSRLKPKFLLKILPCRDVHRAKVLVEEIELPIDGLNIFVSVGNSFDILQVDVEIFSPTEKVDMRNSDLEKFTLFLRILIWESVILNLCTRDLSSDK